MWLRHAFTPQLSAPSIAMAIASCIQATLCAFQPLQIPVREIQAQCTTAERQWNGRKTASDPKIAFSCSSAPVRERLMLMSEELYFHASVSPFIGCGNKLVFVQPKQEQVNALFHARTLHAVVCGIMHSPCRVQCTKKRRRASNSDD